jgi:8-oxo-dGTP pyrophosphatase MutT (NUDIX family)
MLNNLNINYEHPEWEFPKGRKNKDESDIECALREFEEETGINRDKL